VKVIHLISGGDTGGAKTHIHYLLSGLCGQIGVMLVCFMRGGFSAEAEALGIPTVIMDGGLFSVLGKLARLIRADGYDLIHSHGAKGNFMACLLHGVCGVPVVSTVHSDPRLDYLGRPLARLAYGTLNALALRRADYLIGVSEAMRQLLIARGREPNRTFSIYNGVDFSIKPENADRLSYLRGLGLDADEDSVVVGAAARLDPVKDVATLIRGFALALGRCPQLRLIIAGEGAELENLQALAAELGVADRLCFADWVDDIGSFFAALDINALSSLSETFPYALTEGARSRLATVSSCVGGVPKLITDGETGFLFPPGDAAALADRLAALGGSAQLRQRLGDAVYEKAKKEFSVEATTHRQLEIYGGIIRREAMKKRGERNGVLICGAYGMGNAGDDAILEAIIGEMRLIDPFMPVTALSRRPGETRLKYEVNSVHMFNNFALRRALKKTKLYLSGGGSLIQNVTSRRSLWYYLYTITTAKRLGNAVMMYGCGIGPIVDRRDEIAIRRILSRDVDVITLREGHSLSELERLGVRGPEMIVSSDPALSLPPAPEDKVAGLFASCGIAPGEGCVCFSVRSWAGFEEKAGAFAQAADYAAEKLGLKPVFILINRAEDVEATERVRALMRTEAAVIPTSTDSSLTIGVLTHMKAVISMRLHGLIFAASQGVPIVGVSYDPKVTAFLASIGGGNCIELAELSAGTLISAASAAVGQYDDGAARRARAERLIAAEALNRRWAVTLLDRC
jgi:polysaccharide pyruvyl transferase CsaB